jgi:hypothetical protein
VSPGGSPSLGTDQESSATKPADKEKSSVNSHVKSGSHGPYAGDLEDAVQGFYGQKYEEEELVNVASGKPVPSATARDLLLHWNVPKSERPNVQFVLALLPDPIHTQLSLSFDRGIETIQQAAQEQGYDFDRATMPWDNAEHPESTDFVKREQEAQASAAREVFPGLMIFRPTKNARDPAGHGALFVFVIGEAPTGGINKKQFANALAIICEIQDCPGNASAERTHLASAQTEPPNSQEQGPLLILGPSATGSLYSLKRNLDLNQKVIGSKRVIIFSGTLRATGPRCWFQTNEAENVRFLPFQDGENHVIKKFLDYAKVRGYQTGEVSILSENETAYGEYPAAGPPFSPFPGCVDSPTGPRDADDQPQTIQFPRGVSRFRAAYQKQVGRLTQSQDSGGEQRPVLPLSLEESGSEDDSVTSYAKIQTPLSQEAVMLGIISRLHQRHPKLIVLRASDPVDALFLMRYLRQNYPQGRVVVTAPDLLFARDDDGLLHGVLAINAYSLAPTSDRYLSAPQNAPKPSSERAFPSSSERGVYNAMVALLAIRQNADVGDALFANLAAPDSRDLPVAPYLSYGGFADWRATNYCATPLKPDDIAQNCRDSAFAPGLWVSILGRDGYWMAADLPRDSDSALHQINPALAPKTSDADASTPAAQNRGPHTPKSWIFAYSLTLLLLFFQTYLICTGSLLSGSEIKARYSIVEDPGRTRSVAEDECSKGLFIHRRRRARLLAWPAAALAAIALLLAGVRYALVEQQEGDVLTFFLLLLPLCFVFAAARHIYQRRGEPAVAAALVGGLLLLAAGTFVPCIGPLHWITSVTAYRGVHLTSGVSPLLPFLLLIAAVCGLSWYELYSLAFTDCRSPRLPSVKDASAAYYRVSEEYVEDLRRVAMSLSIPKSVFLPILCFLTPLALLTIDFHYPHPVQTIEGSAYDWAYALTLFLWLFLFLGCLSRLIVVWNDSRRFLSGLDTLPLRNAFKCLQDFSWTLIWSPSGSALRDSFKFVSREIENLRHFRNAIRCCKPEDGPPLSEETVQKVETEMEATFTILQAVQDKYKEAMAEREASEFSEVFAKMTRIRRLTESQEPSGKVAAPEQPPAGGKDSHRKEDPSKVAPSLGAPPPVESSNKLAALMDSFAKLQLQLAKTAAVVLKELLQPLWGKVISPVASQVPRDLATKKGACQLVAEEYVALVYASFLASLLLRMRSVVMEAIAIYFFIVLSISSYPFEPNPAMFSLAVILILVMGIVIGYVYSQMHRDPALSRLTSTTEGERGLDFWMQLLGAGAIPVLSLLAAQFPTVSHILISLLQPILQTTK